MTIQDFALALCRGAERVSAWAELLDSINVFPVADGDTGRNLTISLYPLRKINQSPQAIQKELLLSARGNSGNISASFFTSLVNCDDVQSLAEAASLGRQQAYQAVSRPQSGTMLSFFDGLVHALQASTPLDGLAWTTELLDSLANVVRQTAEQQPMLRAAGVVDSGALGMFIFFEAYFHYLMGIDSDANSITNRFGNLLKIDLGWMTKGEKGTCVDVVLKSGNTSADVIQRISDLCEEVVTFEQNGLIKAHLHTDDEHVVRQRLETLGSLVSWCSDDMGEQAKRFGKVNGQPVHVMTDAAGSVTPDDAKRLGMTLLNSYISIGERSFIETHLDSSSLYRAMKEGTRVSTSQASIYERYQHYHGVLSLYPNVLYLCVGSVYTGNYQTAVEWKRESDPEERMLVIDTGAASGKLGLIAMATARFAMSEFDPAKVNQYARQAVSLCQEYVFLDKLHYLAAGGRLSKGSAFFGDTLRIKPIITPLAKGATKVGVVRSRKQQVKFALERAKLEIRADRPGYIMLEYSDNLAWLDSEIVGEFKALFPLAEVFLQPLSRTSGVHMGPGTWGFAFLQPPDTTQGNLRLNVSYA
jgi:DegV family protein with EDD domain